VTQAFTIAALWLTAAAFWLLLKLRLPTAATWVAVNILAALTRLNEES